MIQETKTTAITWSLVNNNAEWAVNPVEINIDFTSGVNQNWVISDDDGVTPL